MYDELPTINVQLATDLIRWAEVSEEMKNGVMPSANDLVHFRGWGLWDQDVWAHTGTRDEDAEAQVLVPDFCGTSFCQAGQAALQEGWKPVWIDQYNRSQGASDARKDGVQKSIWSIGQEALGFTSEEADYYFDGERDIDELKEALNSFLRKRGQAPVYPEHVTW